MGRDLGRDVGKDVGRDAGWLLPRSPLPLLVAMERRFGHAHQWVPWRVSSVPG